MVQFDQESIRLRLINKTKDYFGDVNLVLFGTNQRIFDLVAEELASAMQYDEYLTREAKWKMAKNYSSILSQSDFYNYKPHRKKGSFGKVRISTSDSFNGAYPYNIPIPKFTIVNNGSVNFATVRERILTNNVNYLDVEVKQGTPVEFTYEITSAQFSSGTDYAKILIDSPDIENDNYDVYVNGVLWEEIDHIRLSNSGDQQVYVLNSTNDFSGVEIRFGNNVFGKRVEVGDVVTFKGLETQGTDGNVLSLNSVTTIEGDFRDSNNSSVPLYCTNTEELIGGDSVEDIEIIRVNAPKTYQTGDRAIARADYQALILKGGYADKISVWGEEEVNQDRGNPPGTYLAKEENLVYVAGFDIDEATGLGISLTNAQQATIRSELNPKKSPTDIIQFIDTQFVYIVFHILAFVSDKRYTEEIVRENLSNGLRTTYSLENGSYKKNLYFSNYQNVIDNIEGIDHHETTISYQQRFKLASAYVYDMQLNINNISPGSLKLYYSDSGGDWVHFASDDAGGNIIGELVDPTDVEQGYYQLPGAEINYADGYSGEITITYGLTSNYSFYEIRSDFEVSDSEEGNVLLTKRQQIFAYIADETDVTFMDISQEQ